MKYRERHHRAIQVSPNSATWTTSVARTRARLRIIDRLRQPTPVHSHRR